MTTNTTDLPFIDAEAWYTTAEASHLLIQSPNTLRGWRKKGIGPRYYQPVPRADAKYLGKWIREFREQAVVTPDPTEEVKS